MTMMLLRVLHRVLALLALWPLQWLDLGEAPSLSSLTRAGAVMGPRQGGSPILFDILYNIIDILITERVQLLLNHVDTPSLKRVDSSHAFHQRPFGLLVEALWP